MAGRPSKQSLDFAGWSVDVFDNEPKIDKLIDAQGCVGFTVFFFLCQRAYGSNGYFYEWSFDDAATTARKIGGGVCSQAVVDTVRLCLRVGLFDKDLHDRHMILTSKGIQKRYTQVAATRANKTVIEEYWLLKKEESAGLNIHTLNSGSSTGNLNFAPGNANFAPRNANFQPLKESKVKESIVKDSRVKDDAADTRASSESEFAKVAGYYMDTIDSMPMPSKVSAAIQGYLDLMEPRVITNAMDKAAAQGKRSWSYVNGILKQYKNSRIRNMADVARVDAEFEERKNKNGKSKAGSQKSYAELLAEKEGTHD